jgi:predicted outer membrane protein
MMTPRRYGWLLGALACAGLAAACGGGGDDDDGGGGDGVIVADTAGEDGEAMGATLANRAEGELSGEPRSLIIERLGGIVLALDEGEIAQAETALDLGEDPAVLDFAEHMRRAHSEHADVLEDLLYNRGLAPTQGEVSGMLRTEAFVGIDELRHTPPGQVDFAYLRIQVMMHAAAAVLADRLLDLAPDAELFDFLRETSAAISEHRIQAEAILRAR